MPERTLNLLPETNSRSKETRVRKNRLTEMKTSKTIALAVDLGACFKHVVIAGEAPANL